MRIHVKFFAILREKARASDAHLDLPAGSTCADALKALEQRFPATAPMLKRAACAIDQEYATSDTMLRDGQELALIPPVSGG
jgi:molybdopterin converting factor subunit 1